MREAIIYLLAIAAAEVVTTVTIQPVWGMACHILILAAVIVHSATAGDYRYRQLVLSLALVPLVRIISLAMPLANIPQVWWYPIIYGPLLAAAFIVVRILDFRAEDMVRCPNCGQKTGSDSCQWCKYPILKGRPTKYQKVGLSFGLFPVQVVVGLSGLLFGVAEYFILARPEPMIIELAWQEVWLMALIFLVCTGFVEEFIFRGVLQRTAVEAFGGWGIVYVSLLFATVHLIHYSEVGLTGVLIDIAFVFIIAMFFGWVVKETGSLFGVSLSHGITNIMLYLIAPFLF